MRLFNVDTIPEGVSTAVKRELVKYCLAPERGIWARRIDLHGEISRDIEFSGGRVGNVSEREFEQLKEASLGDPVEKSVYEVDITDATDPSSVEIYDCRLHSYEDFWVAEVLSVGPAFEPFDWLGEDVTESFEEVFLT